jgi:hypothetical protein
VLRERDPGLGPGRRSDGTYCSFNIAAFTALAVSGATRGWLLITRETVELDTPARSATLLMDMTA